MQVTSCANETKWRELQKHMQNDWERAPWWRVKYLPNLIPGTWELRPDAVEHPLSDWFAGIQWDSDWYYHFRSDNVYSEMEFVDMKPRQSPESMSIEELIKICRAIGLDFDLNNEFVRVFGYRRSK